MNRNTRIQCLTGFLVLAAALLHADSRYVSPDGRHVPPFTSWETAATNIQAAVDAATAGATVRVYAGTYRGGGDSVVSITRSLTLCGGSGNPSDVVVDGGGSRRGIVVMLTNAAAVVTIARLTIANGYISTKHGHGAGIYLDHSRVNAGTAQIRKCALVGNVNGSPHGHNHGGGLASRGQAGSSFHTIVTDCVFSDNVTTNRGSSGGGAAFENTRLTLQDCRVENNRAEGHLSDGRPGLGGGVWVNNVTAGSIIRGVVLRGNVADGGGYRQGGGLAVIGSETDLLVENTLIERNDARYGTGVSQRDGTLTLRNCRIAENTGGDAFRRWSTGNSVCRILDCTIVGGLQIGEADGFEAHDSMKDPAVFLDADGAVHPVRTIDDWERRRAVTLRRIEQLAGPLPDPSRFPAPELAVLKDNILEGRLRRQLIVYCTDSMDSPRVKAWLLSPTTNSCLEAAPVAGGRRAAVLCPHQTNRTTGKNEPAGLAGDANMFYALELARRGFVTLAPDFTGSGEHPGLSTYTNNFVSATMKGVADHIRAVDILSALPCVDPDRIGCIGHSLGGFNTMFVSVFDPRIKAVVSSCGYTSWQAYASRKGSLYPFAGPNYMPLISRKYASRADLVPFDWHEVVAALAPRPVFVNAPLRDDPFMVEGVRETLTAARPIYELYGAADVVQSMHPDCGHGFPPEVREKAYRFLERHLGGNKKQ